MAQDFTPTVFADPNSSKAVKEKVAKKITIVDGKKYFQSFSSKCDDQWIGPIVERIENDPNLVSVRIAFSQITDEGLKKLVKALETNKKIALLDLQRNTKTTGEGLMKVADMLVMNDTLTHVYLGKPNRNFTQEAVEHLAKKVVERERKYPNLQAKIDFSEVSEYGDKIDLDRVYADTLKQERAASPAQALSPNT